MLDTATAAALAARRPKIVVFFRLASDPIARAWSGVGDFAVSADAVESTDGAIYKGVGRLSSLPRLEGLINGRAARLSFALNGVDAAVFALADTEWAAANGATVDLGLLALGPDEQPVGGLCWIRRGLADQIITNRQGGLRSISLSVGFGDLSRRRPQLSWWTDSDQRRRVGSSDDRFCERTAIYDVGATLHWPRF